MRTVCLTVVWLVVIGGGVGAQDGDAKGRAGTRERPFAGAKGDFGLGDSAKGDTQNGDTQRGEVVSGPLEAGHAHNDYLHARPLEDALEHGFCGVEADIFLVDGQLLVAHERKTLKPERTLKALYLDPLKQRVAQHGGKVYGSEKRFRLLIDIKTDGERVYEELHKLLYEYREMLSSWENDRWTERAVTVIISGDRPQAAIAAQSVRYCGIDGRLSDLKSDRAGHLMPMISDNWMLRFLGAGITPLTDADRKKLKEITAEAHAHGREVRFWATPDNEALWTDLLDAGVDVINTDDLDRLEKFLRTRTQSK